jgi:hypothetical protein
MYRLRTEESLPFQSLAITASILQAASPGSDFHFIQSWPITCNVCDKSFFDNLVLRQHFHDPLSHVLQKRRSFVASFLLVFTL